MCLSQCLWFLILNYFQTLNVSRLASLPAAYTAEKPYATEYSLAYVTLPKDQEYVDLLIKFLRDDTLDKKLLLSVEYRVQGSPPAARLLTEDQQDIIKGLVEDGLLIVETKRERRAPKLVCLCLICCRY